MSWNAGIRLSGPCVETPVVPASVGFYERFLGWEVEELVGPRDYRPPGADKTPGQKIGGSPTGGPGGRQARETDHAGHLDWWVENLDAGVAWAIDGGAVETAPQPSNPGPRPAPHRAPPRRPPVLLLDLDIAEGSCATERPRRRSDGHLQDRLTVALRCERKFDSLKAAKSWTLHRGSITSSSNGVGRVPLGH